METLAVRYRPKKWEDVTEQDTVVTILKNQIDNGTIKNAYAFCGASGCGKTTCARLFAYAINGSQNDVIEIDAASNNGVDNIRGIIQSATERAIYSTYKIFIMDEAHMLSNQAWNAMLKVLEETPKYTIFIFCTTDPQKIPNTILNRVQRYNFNKISLGGIIKRLKFICDNEGLHYTDEAIEYIARNADGGMRDAISMLDKCTGYSKFIDEETVSKSVGDCNDSLFFDILNGVIDGDEKKVLTMIDTYYNDGKDLKLFVDKFLSFILDVNKYLIFKTYRVTKFSGSYENMLNSVTNIQDAGKYFSYYMNKLLELKQTVKNDEFLKDTIEVYFLQMSRCL